MVTHGLGEDALDCRRVFVQQMLQAGKYMRTVEQGKQRLEVDSETGISLLLPVTYWATLGSIDRACSLLRD